MHASQGKVVLSDCCELIVTKLPITLLAAEAIQRPLKLAAGVSVT